MKPVSLPIKSINHIARVTCDLDASTAFYRDVLGFRPITRPDFGFPGVWLFNHGVQIHLIATTGDPAIDGGDISIRAGHAVFHVADTSVVVGLLKQHSIPYKTNYVAGPRHYNPRLMD